MDEFDRILAGEGAAPSEKALEAIIGHYPWFTTARVMRYVGYGTEDAMLALPLTTRAPLGAKGVGVDGARLVAASPDELIDRFLALGDYRIEAADGDADPLPGDGSSASGEELLNEELARLYLDRGLRDEAVAIYRRLGLLNPEKSRYFAQIIADLEREDPLPGTLPSEIE